MAGHQPGSAWNDPIARVVKREFEKLCVNQRSDMTELSATKFLKDSVDNDLIVIQPNWNNDGPQTLISDPGCLPEEVVKFYDREMQIGDPESAQEAGVLTRRQVRIR